MTDTFIQNLSEIQKARHLVRSKKGLLFAASITQLYCIQGVDIQKQCQSLLKQKKFQLALQLTVCMDIILIKFSIVNLFHLVLNLNYLLQMN